MNLNFFIHVNRLFTSVMLF